MKEKFEFVYENVRRALDGVNTKKISVEQAKAIASLCKQANNVLSIQLDAAKFIDKVKESAIILQEVGLIESKQEDEG